MALLTSALLYTVLAFVNLVRSDCLPEPIVMQLGVGSSPQYFALDASIAFNNTYVWEKCGYPYFSLPFCSALAGGFFDRPSSTTFKPEQDVGAAGGSIEDNSTILTPDISKWATETFVLNSNVTLDEMPLGLVQTAPPTIPGWVHSFQGLVGLGPNSTILNALRASGAIGSHVWSFYYGLTGDSKEEFSDITGLEVNEIQSVGSLVLGGYDAAKVRGNRGTYPLVTDPACPPSQPSLTISDLIINPGNNQTSLLNSSITACIDTTFPGLMVIPLNIYGEWVRITGFNNTNGQAGSAEFVDAGIPGSYSGSLSVKMSDGLVIDGIEMVQPTWTMSTTGQLFANSSQPRVLFTVNINEFQPHTITIGRKFFNTAYIMFNLKKEEFWLWNAHDTDEQQLIAVGDDGSQISTCNSTTGGGDNGPGETGGSGGTAVAGGAGGRPGSQTTTTTSSSLSSGAIAGIVAGSIGSVAFISVAVFFLVRCVKHRVTGGNTLPVDPYPRRETGHELAGTMLPSELHSDFMLAGVELPTTPDEPTTYELAGQHSWPWKKQ